LSLIPSSSNISVGEGLESREDERGTNDGVKSSLSPESGTRALSYPSGPGVGGGSGVGVVIVLDSIGGNELKRAGPRDSEGERGVPEEGHLRREGEGEPRLKWLQREWFLPA
jgi:hypothetical protein